MPAEIVGLGVAVPPYVLTNADLEELVDTNDQWITERTGIKERRVAGKDDSTALLGKRAAEQALKVAGIGIDEVDLVMVATATPDYTLPSAACILQLELGMTRGAAMDVIAGCSGFVYALATASQFVDSGAADTALVVGSETLSRISDYTDRGTCILFGDGAGAVVLRRGEAGVRAFSLGADGARSRLLMTPAGGSRFPANSRTVAERRHYIVMEGREVFKGAVTAMAASSLEAIERSGLKLEDIDLVVPHQANQRIIEATARRLKTPMANVVMNVARYGNTSAASIPIAMAEAWEQGQIRPGQRLLLTAFGAGLAWGSVVVDWTLPNPSEPAPEEPTQPAMPIVRGLLDGTLWDGVDLLPPLRPAVPEAALLSDLEGRTALVTGASGAIGRACAVALAGQGARIVVAYGSDEQGAQETADLVKAAGAEPVVAQADLGDPDAAKGLVAAAGDGGVDILVNNAGLTRDGLVLRMRDEDFTGVLEVNLVAAFRCTREALRGMLRRRWGRVISISSVVGLVGNPGQANYAASKAGLIGLTMSVAREVAGRGITVNAVAPGYIPSKLTDAMSEEAKQATLSQIPMGRLGTPEEVAAAVRFLAGEEAGYITGQVLAVDGGMAMGA